MFRTIRRAGAAAAAVALAAALVSAPTQARPFPDRIELDDGFLPEGIAIGQGPVAWFGSRFDGRLDAFDLRTGEELTSIPGPGTPSVGLKIDNLGRLFVAGGPTGSGRVVDSDTGALLANYQFTANPSFVNDVVLTKDAAWFTDSFQDQLYRVALAPDGSPAATAETVGLIGDWVQGAGFGANGISTTPDGSALLVVHSSSGLLYRVEPVTPTTAVATVVDLGGELLTAGDGLLRHGTTLYAVQNQLNQVAVVQLSPDGTSGEVVDTITSEDFDVPTTVAMFGNGLYLPNARFNEPQVETTEFWATRVER